MKELINHGIKILTNRMLRYSFILILCIAFSSCKSQKNQLSTDSSLVLLVQDGYSGIEKFDTLVIRDQKTLNTFYSKINRTRKPGLPVPKINFTTEMVVVVCMGEQSGNSMPALVEVEENQNEVVLQINSINSNGNAPRGLISSPFCVYKMPLSTKEVIFNKD